MEPSVATCWHNYPNAPCYLTAVKNLMPGAACCFSSSSLVSSIFSAATCLRMATLNLSFKSGFIELPELFYYCSKERISKLPDSKDIWLNSNKTACIEYQLAWTEIALLENEDNLKNEYNRKIKTTSKMKVTSKVKRTSKIGPPTKHFFFALFVFVLFFRPSCGDVQKWMNGPGPLSTFFLLNLHKHCILL